MKIAVVGHSHVEALARAAGPFFPENDVVVINIRKFAKSPSSGANAASVVSGVEMDSLKAEISRVESEVDHVVYCFNGNEHNILGIVELGSPLDKRRAALAKSVTEKLQAWCEFFDVGNSRLHRLMLLPPPPVSDDCIRKSPGIFRDKLADHRIGSSKDRLALYAKQCETIRTIASKFGLKVFELPASVYSQSGFLAADCQSNDPTHGNTEYGQRILEAMIRHIETGENIPGNPHQFPLKPEDTGEISQHPYLGLPDFAFWRQAVSDVDAESLDPVADVPFLIARNNRVATAGSCFAQHISKRLRAGGFSFMKMETVDASPAGAPDYDFSARYGNVYTARQLLQLFDRAFEYFKPVEKIWERREGGYCDPFRPRIKIDGFTSKQEVLVDTKRHLAAVRKMFRQLDVFVFTLGLTECWSSRLDGAVYPIAPGVSGGIFDARKYEFLNFTAAEVTADLDQFLRKLRLVNPRSRVILTVSPVPLAATAAGRHVLVSTTYSKAALRVAADEIVRRHHGVIYFPSYEIITGPHSRGRYFGPDARSVTEAGVDHVMGVFMRRMTEGSRDPGGRIDPADSSAYTELEALAEAECDEEMLQR